MRLLERRETEELVTNVKREEEISHSTGFNQIDNGENFQVRFREKLNTLRRELYSNTDRIETHEKRLDSIDTLCTLFNAMGPTIRQHTEEIKQKTNTMVTLVDEMTVITRQLKVNKEVSTHVANICRTNKDRIAALDERWDWNKDLRKIGQIWIF